MTTKQTKTIVEFQGSDAEINLPKELFQRLDADLQAAASKMSRSEARALVDAYYISQEDRKRNANQQRAHSETGDPNLVISWLGDCTRRLEAAIKRALMHYSEGSVVGRWLVSLYGVGPVLASGFLAHMDVTRAKGAGGFWRFAGLDPSVNWKSAAEAKAIVDDALPANVKKITDSMLEGVALQLNRSVETLVNIRDTLFKKEKWTRDLIAKVASVRPWNAGLKTLCWKFTDTQLKFKGKPECYYGKLLDARLTQERLWNEEGQNVEACVEKLEKFNIGMQTEARKYYDMGMLPPAHVLARAKRWVAKLFLSHLFDIMWAAEYKTYPPKPYVFSVMGHDEQHMLYPPEFEDWLYEARTT